MNNSAHLVVITLTMLFPEDQRVFHMHVECHEIIGHIFQSLQDSCLFCINQSSMVQNKVHIVIYIFTRVKL